MTDFLQTPIGVFMGNIIDDEPVGGHTKLRLMSPAIASPTKDNMLVWTKLPEDITLYLSGDFVRRKATEQEHLVYVKLTTNIQLAQVLPKGAKNAN